MGTVPASPGLYKRAEDVGAVAALDALIASHAEVVASLRETRAAAASLCRIIAKNQLADSVDRQYDGFGKRSAAAIARAEELK